MSDNGAALLPLPPAPPSWPWMTLAPTGHFYHPLVPDNGAPQLLPPAPPSWLGITLGPAVQHYHPLVLVPAVS